MRVQLNLQLVVLGTIILLIEVFPEKAETSEVLDFFHKNVLENLGKLAWSVIEILKIQCWCCGVVTLVESGSGSHCKCLSEI